MKHRKRLTWHEVNVKIEQSFSDVTHIDLNQYLAGYAAHQECILIDVRTKYEYTVSHIPNAIHICDVEEFISFAQQTKKTLVVYCSAGYRSAEVARKLQKLDITHVVNLKGSIFSWANSGLALFNDRGQTKTVHPFNHYWGQLLNSNIPTQLKPKDYHPNKLNRNI